MKDYVNCKAPNEYQLLSDDTKYRMVVSQIKTKLITAYGKLQQVFNSKNQKVTAESLNQTDNVVECSFTECQDLFQNMVA